MRRPAIRQLSRARRSRRLLAPAVAALALLCAGSACGTSDRGVPLKPVTPGNAPRADQVRLVVSRDYGSSLLKDVVVPAADGLNVMRLLAEQCEVETAYGGGFVQGIDGLVSSFGSTGGDQAADWFYWVDGRMGQIGAGAQELRGGQTVWWDYHSWDGAMFIPAAVNAFPAPFAEESMLVEAPTTAWREAAAHWAAARGLKLWPPSGSAQAADSAARLVLTTPRQAMANPVAGPAVEAGPSRGVFLTVERDGIRGLCDDGAPGSVLRAAAFATPHPDHPEKLCLVVIAEDERALRDLLQGFTPERATAHVALGLHDDRVVPLPLAKGSP